MVIHTAGSGEELTIARQAVLKAAVANAAGVAVSDVALTVSPSIDGVGKILTFDVIVRQAGEASAVATKLGAVLDSAAAASGVIGISVAATPSISTVLRAGAPPVAPSPVPPGLGGATSGDNGGVVVALAVVVGILGLIVLFMWKRTKTSPIPVTRSYGQRDSEVTISRTNCNSYEVNQTEYGYNLDHIDNDLNTDQKMPHFDKL